MCSLTSYPSAFAPIAPIVIHLFSVLQSLFQFELCSLYSDVVVAASLTYSTMAYGIWHDGADHQQQTIVVLDICLVEYITSLVF